MPLSPLPQPQALRVGTAGLSPRRCPSGGSSPPLCPSHLPAPAQPSMMPPGLEPPRPSPQPTHPSGPRVFLETLLEQARTLLSASPLMAGRGGGWGWGCP